MSCSASDRPHCLAKPSCAGSSGWKCGWIDGFAEPPEVVVEICCSVMRPASASAKRDVSSSACERRSSAHTCRPGHALDDVLRDEREVAGAAVVAGHEQRARAWPPMGPTCATKTLSYFAGPGPGAPATVSPSRPPRRGAGEREPRGRSPTQSGSHGGATYHGGVAVLIASDLAKDMAGEPLLRGVSFKLERRERMTIAGRNGAGKTTLLRMLAGRDLDRRRRARARQGHARGAARPAPAARARPHACATTSSRAASEPLRARGRARSASSTRWPRATSRRIEPLRRRAGALRRRRRLRLARAGASVVHGLGFVDDDLDRALSTFSGGQLTRASLARALAAQPDLLLLDEPTNHLDIESLEWLEQTLLDLDAAIVLVAHDRWFLETVGTAVLELEAGRSRFFHGTWHAVAPRAGRARDGARQARSRSRRPRSSAWSASSSASATRRRRRARRRIALKKLDKIERIERDPRDGAGLEFAFKKPERSGRVIFELEDGAPAGRRRSAARPARTTPSCGSSAASTSRSSAPNGTGKTTLIQALVGERAARRRAPALGPQRQDRLPQPARRGARGRRRAHGARGGGQAHRPAAQQGARAARRASCSAARRSRSRSTGSAAASAAGCRWRSSCSRAPTS